MMRSVAVTCVSVVLLCRSSSAQANPLDGGVQARLDGGVQAPLFDAGDAGSLALFGAEDEALTSAYSLYAKTEVLTLRAEADATAAVDAASAADHATGHERTNRLGDAQQAAERASDARRAVEQNALAMLRLLAQAEITRASESDDALPDTKRRIERLRRRIDDLERRAESAAERAQEALRGAAIPVSKDWRSAWQNALRARCVTAICWGGRYGRSQGVEPVVDLPVGLSWGYGHGALSDFINSSEFRLEFTAGLRIWFRDDLVSVMIYFAKPLFTGDARIRPLGSEISYPTSAVRRVYPSIGIGLLGDILFIGVGLDELRNPSSLREADPRYTPGAVVSRSLTFTLGLAPFTAIRNGIGAASEKSRP